VYDRVKSALDDGRNVYQFDLTYTYEITFHEAYSVICDIRKDYWGIYVKEKLGGLEWYRKNNKLKPIYCPKCGVEMEHIESYERIMGTDVIVCRNYDCKGWVCGCCSSAKRNRLRMKFYDIIQESGLSQSFSSVDEWLNSENHYDKHDKEVQNLLYALKYKKEEFYDEHHVFDDNVFVQKMNTNNIYCLSSLEFPVAFALSNLDIDWGFVFYIPSYNSFSLQNVSDDNFYNKQVVLLDSCKALIPLLINGKDATFKYFCRTIQNLLEEEKVWHPYKTTCSVAMVHDMRNDSYESEIRELTSFFIEDL
jgi:hypothetical protein